MSKNSLKDLQNWFLYQTQVFLRKGVKIQIGTLDNPGWSLDVVIDSHNFMINEFSKVAIERTEDDWYFCYIENKIFKGRCGPKNLEDVLNIFLNWVIPSQDGHSNDNKDTLITELQNWYFSQCNGDWEHCYGTRITTTDSSNWSVLIEITETELEDKPFTRSEIKRDEDNWCTCWVEDSKFHGLGGLHNLEEIVDIFITWALSEEQEINVEI